MIPAHINGRYRLKEKIRSGTYGEVYHASDIISGGDVVIKLQCIKGTTTSLEHKNNVLLQLGDTAGIPHVHWFGREDSYDALVLDCLGQSLESVFKVHQHSFSRNTVVFIACQIVCHLQYIHSKYFIHRDLKPNNILIRTGQDAHRIYLVDFGISQQFRYPRTHHHIAFKQTASLTGTPAFTPINSHAGMELGRRDDIESFAYILIYLFRGSLPWLHCSGISDNEIIEMKCDTTNLCQGLPDEVERILTYSRSLSFDEKPDYTLLHCLLRCINSTSESYQQDHIPDWSTISPKPCRTRISDADSTMPCRSHCLKLRAFSPCVMYSPRSNHQVHNDHATVVDHQTIQQCMLLQ
ncbi:kinase-like domain-containing protein [Suillus subluteus]|nr:kinase-like domain-containing protein [Suillus subluteus]